MSAVCTRVTRPRHDIRLIPWRPGCGLTGCRVRRVSAGPAATAGWQLRTRPVPRPGRDAGPPG